LKGKGLTPADNYTLIGALKAEYNEKIESNNNWLKLKNQ
jgi:hypothetical protein